MQRLLLACSILALCVPALALADGGDHTTTLTGTVTANPSGSVTVASTSATITCTVPSRAITSVAKLKLGAMVKIACRATVKDGLVLTGIQPITSHDDHHDLGQKPPPPPPTGTTSTGTTSTGTTQTATTPHTGDGNGDHNTGTPTTAKTPPPPATAPQKREAVGIVFFLSSTGVAVRPDKGGDVLTCAITPAPDSAAAAAKLTLNGHFDVGCRLDGGRYVLASATPAP